MILGSIVLTGGKGERMGKPKEALPWGDSTLLRETVLTLLDCSYPVVVAARDADQELPPLHTECDLVYDGTAGDGPLAGIQAGFEFAADRCDAILVVGCDMPFLTSRAIGWLSQQLGDHDAVVPRIDDELQPLCAIYRSSVRSIIGELVASGERRAQALPEAIGTRGGKLRVLTATDVDAFDPERRFLRNVNTEDEYARALRDAGQ